MTKYSQQDEQRAILEAFADDHKWNVAADPGLSARFLDVGAWHPIIFSNTRALFELGWSGVMIEPSPGPFLNLLRCCVKCGDVPNELYGDRKDKLCKLCGSHRYGYEERLTLVLAAVEMEESSSLRLEITDDAVSSSDPNTRNIWKDRGGYFGWGLVGAISMEMIQLQFGGFDFINLDAEGLSVDLFRKAMELNWAPRCFCVEHDNRTTELLALATSKGYHCTYSNDTNVILVRG